MGLIISVIIIKIVIVLCFFTSEFSPVREYLLTKFLKEKYDVLNENITRTKENLKSIGLDDKRYL